MDPSEHIQEYLQLEGSDELSDYDVAMGVADVMCAQGLIGTSDAELDLAVHQIQQQVNYYRGGSR